LTGITCESTLTTRELLQRYKTCLLRGYFRLEGERCPTAIQWSATNVHLQKFYY